MKGLRAIDAALGKLEEWAATGLLLTILFLAVAQVVARNVLHKGMPWADEAVRQLTFLLGLVGAAIATRTGRHISVEVVGKLLTPRRQLLVSILVGLFAAAACGWLAYGGYLQAAIAKKKETQTVLLFLKSWHLQASVPIGFGVFALHFLLRVAYDVAALVQGGPAEPAQAAPDGRA